jgi:6-phosphogluconolactonase
MIKIFPNIEELNKFAAETFIEIANQAIEKQDNFTVALAGGSTPKSLYRLLASEKIRNQINWKKVYFFFGDERNVLPDDEESNFRMANENLFEPLQISEWKISRWLTEYKQIEKIVENYKHRLIIGFSLAANNDESLSISSASEENWFPRFDLILLGMGADGHTASLFPHTKALHETERLAVANYVEKLNDWRFTLTFPVINNAANVMFLVSGAEKAEALREVLQGEYQPDKFPSQKVKLNDGNLLWLIDGNAARLLQ